MELRRAFLLTQAVTQVAALSAGGVALSSRARPARTPAGIIGLACRPSALIRAHVGASPARLLTAAHR
jgi:hypothetical protein